MTRPVTRSMFGFALLLVGSLSCDSPAPPMAEDKPSPRVSPSASTSTGRTLPARTAPGASANGAASKHAAMRFRWPAPGVVVVHEAAEKKGDTAEMVYELHSCPNGDGTRVRYRRFRFTTFNGQPASEPALAQALAQATAIAKLVPDLRIGKDGRIVEVEGLDAAFAAVMKTIVEPEIRSTMERLVKDPKMAALIQSKSKDIWRSWVGAWRLYEPSGDATQRFITEVPTGRGGSATRHHEVVGEAAPGNLLRLSTTKTEGNAELKDTLLAIVASLELPDDEAANVLRNASIERTTTWRVLTDPATLQPSTSETTQNLKVSIPEQGAKTRSEVHRYRFDWEAGSKISADCP